MDEIIYTTPIQQIEKLKEQNMIIADEKYALEQLQLCGYSNLIKSYRDPYVISSNGKKLYRSGISFEQVHSLYMLDKNLRNAVMSSMLDLEEHIKEAAADVVASSFGCHQDNYLQFRNYRDKSKKKERFSLGGILGTMKFTLETDKNPIAHYSQVHNIVPPWILFKSIYFSTMINFIHQFKPNEQKKMVSHLYDSAELNLPDSVLPELMMNTLFICLEYRNIAAHGGRTYNYFCKSRLQKDKIFGPNNNLDLEGFSLLLFLLSLLKYKTPFNHLSKVLNQELTRHCNRFPQDITYLGQILNLDIVGRKMAYITEHSNKYHLKAHCSGIQNIKRLELSEVLSQGYIACKRCALGSTKET